MGNNPKNDEIEKKYLLFGLLNAFTNRLQAVGDTFFDEISWKQWFVLIGIELYENPPTINEVADVIGSSHQNVKQILLKLEKLGFVELYTDEFDRRKQRISTTDRKKAFDQKYSKKSLVFMQKFYQDICDNDIEITMKTLLKMEQNLINIKNRTEVE